LGIVDLALIFKMTSFRNIREETGRGPDVVGESVGEVVGVDVVGEPVGETVSDDVVGEPVGEVVGDSSVGSDFADQSSLTPTWVAV
jgi:hypothetical protein